MHIPSGTMVLQWEKVLYRVINGGGHAGAMLASL